MLPRTFAFLVVVAFPRGLGLLSLSASDRKSVAQRGEKERRNAYIDDRRRRRNRTSLRKLLPPIYPDLLLSDLKAPADLGTREIQGGGSADLAQVEALCEGVDGILHFGGYSVEGRLGRHPAANIIGGYNLFEAARKKGVKRVVFASSNHCGRLLPAPPPDRHRRHRAPDSRYGVSKVFGEAVGALYADKHGLGVTSAHRQFRRQAAGSSPAVDLAEAGDLVQLCRIGLDHPDIHFEIFYGASYNERRGGTIIAPTTSAIADRARRRIFASTPFAEQAKLGPDPVGDFYQGGAFCGMEFDGDKRRIIDWR
jgi:Nucleoside-diphosphate-sugar epimerases